MRRGLLAIVPILVLACFTAVARARVLSPSSVSTGNLLVLLDRTQPAASAGRLAVDALIAGRVARRAGLSVPAIGLITVRPGLGIGLAWLAAKLRRLPGIASVRAERRYVPRTAPDDPALSAFDRSAGTTVQWVLARENFYRAWSISKGDGALVGVIDTGVDASHPELAAKIAVAVDQQGHFDARGTRLTDEVGHGTHVASLACAATNNGIGMAGAGYNCKLVVEKSDLSDSSIASSIVDATNRGVQALNMSFGPSSATPSPAPASEVRALDYAAGHKVVLVAAAADSPVSEQGDPANVLQPAGTGPRVDKGLGLDVTAADYSGRRASFAGSGTEISLAAYGALKPDSGTLLGGPPPGIFGAFPANSTDLEALPQPCGCRTTFRGSRRYAYLQGTSMAAPQVAATAAMMRVLNPYAHLSDVLRTLKLTADRRQGAGWSADEGWGVLDAGAALDAIRRIDRVPPVARLVAPRIAGRRAFVLRWSGHDPRRAGLIASGIATYQVYVRAGGRHARLLVSTRRHSLVFHGAPGHRYVFFVIAIDRAGNRQRRAATVITHVAPNAR